MAHLAGYSEQERLAAEFAHRFATEHTKLREDEDFWSRCGEHFSTSCWPTCVVVRTLGRHGTGLADAGHRQACMLTLQAAPSRA